jgi:CopG family transcriptional regulator/antitoxin EndoAI
MHKRINVTLPEETIRLIDRVSQKGDRSRLINQAVKHYLETTGRANLKRRLKEGAESNAERDLQLTHDWFSLEEEAWQKST